MILSDPATDGQPGAEFLQLATKQRQDHIAALKIQHIVRDRRLGTWFSSHGEEEELNQINSD